MPHDSPRDRSDGTVELARRALLRAAGASAALSLGTGSAVAAGDDHGTEDKDGEGTPSTPHAEDGRSAPSDIDPVFGLPSAGPNPCGDDAGSDCFDGFPEDVRPDHEVELHIGVPEILLLFGAFAPLDPDDPIVANVNAAVSDGTVDEGELEKPEGTVTIPLPGGGSETLTVGEVADLLAGTEGFHYNPAGLRVRPGDVVLFSAETPDHGVAAFHERHGRQNRVPADAPPFAAPLVPVGGYCLYRFDAAGVYDIYCPPHQIFGMVLRVVVAPEEGPVPSLRVEGDGRPPTAENLLPSFLGGLDPNSRVRWRRSRRTPSRRSTSSTRARSRGQRSSRSTGVRSPPGGVGRPASVRAGREPPGWAGTGPAPRRTAATPAAGSGRLLNAPGLHVAGTCP